MNRLPPSTGMLRRVDAGVPAFVGEVRDSLRAGVTTLSSPRQLDVLFADRRTPLRASLEGYFALGGRRCHVLHVPRLDRLEEAEQGRAILGEDAGPGQRSGLHALADLEDVSTIAVPGKTSVRVWEAVLVYLAHRRSLSAVLEGRFPEPTDEFLERVDRVEARISRPGNLPGLRERVSWLEHAPARSPGDEAGSYTAQLALAAGAKRGESAVIPPSGPALALLPDRRRDRPPPSRATLGRWFRGNSAARSLDGLPTPGTRMRTLRTWRRWEGLRRSLDLGTRWVLFEVLDPFLAPRVEREVRGFLHGLLEDGVLEAEPGRPPFEVHCHGEATENPRGWQGQLVVRVRARLRVPGERGVSLDWQRVESSPLPSGETSSRMPPVAESESTRRSKQT